MTEVRSISTVLLACVLLAFGMFACGARTSRLYRPIEIDPLITKEFHIGIREMSSETPIRPDELNMYEPPGLPADYFAEGNIMVEVDVGIDNWPPQKLEIDFDGSLSLFDFEEVDYCEYPYLNSLGNPAEKILYILWPSDDPPPAEVFWFGGVWGTLVDRSGVVYHSPEYPVWWTEE